MVSYVAYFAYTSSIRHPFFISDSDADQTALISAVVTYAANDAGTFDFSCLSKNKIAAKILSNTFDSTLITVNRIIDGVAECIFKGRPSSVKIDGNNVISVSCDGLLADTATIELVEEVYEGTPVTSYGNNPEGVFKWVLASIANKKLRTGSTATGFVTPGTCSVTGPAPSGLKLASGSGLSWLNKLREQWGGYFIPTYADNLAENVTLSWFSEATEISKQDIVYGLNLVDISTEYDATSVANAIIPIGKDNLMLDYVTNPTQSGAAYRLFGRGVFLYAKFANKTRWKVFHYDTITSKTDLLNAAKAELGLHQNPERITNIEAVDLAYLGDKNPFKLFSTVQVLSPMHEAVHRISGRYTITKLRIDMVDPTNCKAFVDGETKTLTALIKKE